MFESFFKVEQPKGTIFHKKPKRGHLHGLLIVMRPPCKRTILLYPQSDLFLESNRVRLQFPYMLYRLSYYTTGFWRKRYHKSEFSVAFAKTPEITEYRGLMYSVPLPNFTSNRGPVCFGEETRIRTTATLTELFNNVVAAFWNTRFVFYQDNWDKLDSWRETDEFPEEILDPDYFFERDIDFYG